MNSISFAHEPVPGLVSIVVPTYCMERYIGQALDSIAAQSYPHWELIVVEDGSLGPTQQIVEAFARRHPQHRVEYSRNDRNRGVSHSRNFAFAKTSGEFVALLDADDRWLPDHLAKSIEQLRASGADLAYSSVELVEDASDRPLGVWGPQPHELEDFTTSLYHRNFILPSATVMRRAVLAEVGAWDTELNHCEDLDFWLRCLRANKSFCLVGGCNCLYRKNHAGAATGRVCATLEKFAEVVERYPSMPGTSARRLRRQSARAYQRAAHVHAVADPSRDPSADRSRCVPLMLRAWSLRPARVDYLLKLAKYAVANHFRRPSHLVPTSPTENVPTPAAA
jgi:Glycosyl transferase family 2